ncbi:MULTISPECIES: PLP-dependent aminotransferase family protein [unclassified Vibrio]|uniref:PLP-dependent aminotransferase family protein n=1 Tax=Vibrio sp. HB236076 TaxID=3232307 RepID=A0AB39HFH7_9VIBR|nr:PLP-dependent aminotransferase family protein [Vibrio sp. HB161653]MDP5253288.1 PLP-dependent aminotransferase family protein [Vibrio sp. HB161653]
MKSDHLIHIQFRKDRSLQEQIREYLIESITQGLFLDHALPSCRKMAEMLNVSRNTVVLVYERLVDEGYIYTKPRSGYFAKAMDDDVNAQRPFTTERAISQDRQARWQERFKINLRTSTKLKAADDWQTYAYPFIFGQPDPSLFPLAQWRECGRLSQRQGVIKDWVTDAIDVDDELLIKQLQAKVLSKRGITAKPDEILITIGTQNSLYLLAEMLMAPGTRVGVEEPGYPDIRQIVTLKGASVVPLALDDHGVRLSDEMATCDYVYTTPSHQVPTNVTMSMDRRKALLDFAQQHDVMIIEDDFDSEVNIQERPSPALKSLDSDQRVIYVGSLSKSLSPGLRIGFLVADRCMIEQARQLRRLMYRHPPSNNQKTCGLFLSLGHYDTYVRKLRKSYQQKWSLMTDLLREHMPNSIMSNHTGGSAFWLKLPPGVDSRDFVRQAKQQGLLVESGDIHFMLPCSTQYQYIRVGFSAIKTEKIAPGILALAQLYHQQCGPKVDETGPIE